MQTNTTAFARSFPSLVFHLLCSLSAGALISAHAASPSIWDGGGANDYWNNATNWGGNLPVPGTAYDLQFGGTTRLTPNNDFPALSNFRHITFDSGAGALTLSGNSITLNGHITNNSASLQTINLPISTGAGRYVATTSGNITFGGAISGNGGLNLVGPGAVTLSGKNTFTNYVYVNGGILNLPTGASINNRYFIFAGQNVGHSGALNITGGTLTNTQPSNTGNLMIGRSGYGSFNMSSGSVRVNTVYIGWQSGLGVALISGGSFYCGTADYIVVGFDNVTPGTGVLTVSGGLLSHPNSTAPLSLNNNANDRGELNVLGGTVDNSGGSVTFGYNSALANLGTGAGIVNLNGGNLMLNRFVAISKNAGPAGASFVNFNGGTLTATAYNAICVPNLSFSSNFIASPITVYVNGAFGTFSGGSVIDTAGQDCLISSPLLAPTGNGISSLPVTDSGVGYIGVPYVSVTGDGTGATAIANMVDDGTGRGTLKVDSITVCNPGIGYSSPSVTLIGGAPATAATLGTPTTAANTSGGLTKNGAGTLTLKGADTYTGATIVNAGRLIVSSAQSGGSSITAKDGASFGVARDSVTTALVTPSLTLGATSGAEVDFVLPDGNPAAEIITAGTLTLNGTNNVVVSGASFAPGQFSLIKYTTLIGDPGSLTNGVLTRPDGTLGYLVHNPGNSSFDLKLTTVSGALKWTGTVNSGGVGLWDNLTTANWFGNGASRVFIPGADTTLDDTAAGVTTIGLVGTIEPGSVTVDNSTRNYTLGGTGTLGGTMSLTKFGTGTLTMTNATTYSGATTVSGGTVIIGGSLSNNAGSVTVNGGTLTASSPIKTGTGAWSAGSTSSAKGIVNLNAGSAIELNGSFIVGSIADGSGAVNVTGGTLTNTQASTAANFEIATTGYGALNMSGGLVKVNTFYVGGGSGVGTALISGGTFHAGGVRAADYLLVGGINAGTGVLTVSGGFLNHSNVNRLISVNNNSDGRGELNLLGGAIDNSGGGVGYGYNSGTGTGTGIVNLNGGNLTLNRFVNTKQDGTFLTGNAYLNFNGGTVTASPSTLTSPNLAFSSSFMPARMLVWIRGAFGAFTGGAVIDTAGQDCLVESALLAPTGSGVSALAVVDGGAGYIGAPYVSIGGDGVGATAIANMVPDGSGALKVGSITVCNPGVDYTYAYFSFTGGAPTVAATPGNAALAVNTSGGLTKNGAGVLTLAGTNTYTGATIVNGGSLRVNGSLDAGSAVTVASGAALGGNGVIGGTVSVQSGGILSPGTSIGTLSISNTLTLAAGSTTFVEVNASSGDSDLVQGITTVNYGGTLVVSNTAGTLTPGQTFQLFSAAGHNYNFASIQSAGGGATWEFNPTNGVLSVVSVVATTPTNISFALSGSILTLTWPHSHLGWYAQSNSVSVADANAWYDIPNSQMGTNLSITINPAMSKVFYRLRNP
jgi:autotransporter-associated beta strand protein